MPCFVNIDFRGLFLRVIALPDCFTVGSSDVVYNPVSVLFHISILALQCGGV